MEGDPAHSRGMKWDDLLTQTILWFYELTYPDYKSKMPWGEQSSTHEQDAFLLKLTK